MHPFPGRPPDVGDGVAVTLPRPVATRLCALVQSMGAGPAFNQHSNLFGKPVHKHRGVSVHASVLWAHHLQRPKAAAALAAGIGLRLQKDAVAAVVQSGARVGAQSIVDHLRSGCGTSSVLPIARAQAGVVVELPSSFLISYFET